MENKDNNNGCLWVFVAALVIFDVIKSICMARIIAKEGWQAFANSGWMKVTYVITAIFFVFVVVVWGIVLVIWIKEKLENNNDSQDTIL